MSPVVTNIFPLDQDYILNSQASKFHEYMFPSKGYLSYPLFVGLVACARLVWFSLFSFTETPTIFQVNQVSQSRIVSFSFFCLSVFLCLLSFSSLSIALFSNKSLLY